MNEIIGITSERQMIYRDREKANQAFENLGNPSFLNKHWHMIWTVTSVLIFLTTIITTILLVENHILSNNNPLTITLLVSGFTLAFLCALFNLSFSPRIRRMIKIHDELNQKVDLPMNIMLGEHTFRKGFDPYDAHMTAEDQNAYIEAMLDTSRDSEKNAVAVHDTLARTYINI